LETIQGLDEISKQVSFCKNCGLSVTRKSAVPGEGPSNSRIMFIGEGPGFHEDQQGRPFVGAAGKFLEELLGNAGLKRNEVFITNVVKCRPPGNRDPQEDELAACANYLDRQIEIINPEVIVTLGRFSMAKFFGNVKISQIHGQARMINGRLVVAMFHPAAALHQPGLKSTLINDFSKLPGFLKTIVKKEYEVQKEILEHKIADKIDPPQPSQLSLF
jgi:DNA polymerase